jgi:Pyridoxamine 5'-phosphate oxidase
LVAWLAAFVVVMTLLTLFGDELGSLPLALRALVLSGVLVGLMANLVMPVVSATIARWEAGTPRTQRIDADRPAEDMDAHDTPSRRKYPRLAVLPDWPIRTIAVLSTVDHGPHAIPVSAPVRAGDHRILLSLHRDRGSLARLRKEPRVALLLLTEGDVAFTARGRARLVAEPLAGASEYVAIAIAVEAIDDHRQASFRVESGVNRIWIDEGEQMALGQRVGALRKLAGGELVGPPSTQDRG